MTARPSTALVLIFLTLWDSKALEGKDPRRAEQLHFSAEEDKVKNPVSIPRDALAILAKDEMVREELENENIQPGKIPLSWFSTSAIHLSNTRDVDLIVMAVGPIHGANVAMFWLFRANAHGYGLILRAGGHDLDVKNTRSKGYCDIELSAVVTQKLSTVLYRFDGVRYRQYQSRLEEIQ